MKVKPTHSLRRSFHSVDFCKGCHPVQFREWESSVHRHAADDAVVNWLELQENLLHGGGLRASQGAHAPNLCVRCHAPIAAYEQIVSDPLRTMIAQIRERGSYGQEGVSCLGCHTVQEKESNALDDNTNFQLSDIGVNTMFFRPELDAVMTGLHVAGPNRLSKGSFPPESGHSLIAHGITTNLETGSVLQTADDWIEQDPSMLGNTSSRGFSGLAGASAGICESCHTVALRIHLQGFSEDPPEQSTIGEWKNSDAFSVGTCLECHMSRLPDPEVAKLIQSNVDASGVVHDAPRTIFPTGDFADASVSGVESSLRFRDANRTNHSFTGGYNVLNGHGQPDHFREIAATKVAMYQRTLTLQPLAHKIAGGYKIGLNVTNVLAGHDVPTGQKILRQLWASVAVRCGEQLVFSSGQVQASEDLEPMEFKTYSEIFGARPKSAIRDFYIPGQFSGDRRQNDLILFNDNLIGTEIRGNRSKPVFDFFRAKHFSRFSASNPNHPNEQGPIGSIRGENYKKLYYETVIRRPTTCPANDKLTYEVALKLRFLPPYLLKALKMNIEKSNEAAKIGFPKEALDDIIKKYIDPIDDPLIARNEIYTVTSASIVLD